MEGGPIHSGHRKKMTRLGYDAQYWHLKAAFYGAALRQSRLAVIYTKQGATVRPGVNQACPHVLTVVTNEKIAVTDGKTQGRVE
jgi:hypothetical protein